jgi:hypothetical protein
MHTCLIFTHGLLGLFFGYVISSLVESITHQKISDAPAKSLKSWSRHPLLFKALILANYSHHAIHHRKTFRGSYVEQFRSESERMQLDAELLKRGDHGRTIIKSRYAIKLQGRGIITFTIPFAPFTILMYILFDSGFAAGFTVASMLPPLLSNYIHPFLHMPYNDALAKAPRITRLLLKTRYFRRMIRHHYLHHRYMACNFNLLLGGDRLRQALRDLVSGERQAMHKRVFRVATSHDLEHMKSLGLPVD